MVVDVYRHLLNRGPDPEGMKNAGIFVSMRGSASLVDQLVDSPEYRERFGDWSIQARASVIAPLASRAAGRRAARLSLAAAIASATARMRSTKTASITSTSTATATSTVTSGIAAKVPFSGST